MATERINFTKATLTKIVPPVRKESKKGGVYDTYYDTGEKGLVLAVSNGGAKTFYLYMRVHGTPKRIKLGAFPDLTIEQARKAAQANKGMIAQGKDPHAEKRRINDEITFAEFYRKEYLERHAKRYNRSWENDLSRFERHLKPFHSRRLSNIRQDDIQRLHGRLAKEYGISCANRVLTNVHAIYNKAIEWGWQGINPAHGIKKFREKSRDRFLQPEELPRFFAALDAEPNKDMSDYFYMLLLTGARRRNVASMHWKDISLDLATWTIPETKNGESYIVNLSKQALEILAARVHTKPNGWVFPSETSKSGHIEEPKSTWKRILQHAEIEDLRIHDLRRTLGSYQAITGANSYIIGKSLGHKSSAATEVYARLNADPVRESVERAVETIMRVGKIK